MPSRTRRRCADGLLPYRASIAEVAAVPVTKLPVPPISLRPRYKPRLDVGPKGPIALSIADTLILFASTPTPTPSPGFDETAVTPGPLGFAIVFVIAVVTVLLILDMTRRIRRTRYRAEVRERLESEQDGDGGVDGGPPKA